MKTRTQLLNFDQETRRAMLERDGYQCIFCKIGYMMHDNYPNNMDDLILDPMHFIGKGQGGLGILENGACGCRWHHSMLDNGNKNNRDEMIGLFEVYLRSHYVNWSRSKLKFKKEMLRR